MHPTSQARQTNKVHLTTILSKEIWQPIDIVCALLFGASILSYLKIHRITKGKLSII